MKTITITLDKTLADLQKEEGLDFSRDIDDVWGEAKDWFVVNWVRSWDGDVAIATCCFGESNTLYTLYGIDNY